VAPPTRPRKKRNHATWRLRIQKKNLFLATWTSCVCGGKTKKWVGHVGEHWEREMATSFFVVVCSTACRKNSHVAGETHPYSHIPPRGHPACVWEEWLDHVGEHHFASQNSNIVLSCFFFFFFSLFSSRSDSLGSSSSRLFRGISSASPFRWRQRMSVTLSSTVERVLSPSLRNSRCLRSILSRLSLACAVHLSFLSISLPFFFLYFFSLLACVRPRDAGQPQHRVPHAL